MKNLWLGCEWGLLEIIRIVFLLINFEIIKICKKIIENIGVERLESFGDIGGILD